MLEKVCAKFLEVYCWICKWCRRLIRLTETLLNLCTTCLKLTKYSWISCPTMVCNECSFSKTVRSLTVGSLENHLATADFATTKGKQQHPIGRAKVTNSSTPQTSRKSYLPVPLSNFILLILIVGNSMYLFFP